MSNTRSSDPAVFDKIDKSYVGSVMPFMNNFVKVKFNTFELEKINQVCINHLKVKDKFMLNDRFEGKAYLTKMTHSLMAIMAIEKICKEKIIDWERLNSSKNYELNKIFVKSQEHIVFPFVFGSLPVLSNIICPIIFVLVQVESRFCYVCGIADIELLYRNCNLSNIEDSRINKKFRLFGELKNVETI